MSEPAIAVNQEGLGRRREEIEKVSDETKNCWDLLSYPVQPGQPCPE